MDKYQFINSVAYNNAILQKICELN